MSQVASPLIAGAAFLSLSCTTVDPLYDDDTLPIHRANRWTSVEPSRASDSIVGANMDYVGLALLSDERGSSLASRALSVGEAQRLALFEAAKHSLVALVNTYPYTTASEADADAVSPTVAATAAYVLATLDVDIPLPRVSATRDGEVALLWKAIQARIDAVVQDSEHLIWVQSDRGTFVQGGEIDLARNTPAELWKSVRQLVA